MSMSSHLVRSAWYIDGFSSSHRRKGAKRGFCGTPSKLRTGSLSRISKPHLQLLRATPAHTSSEKIYGTSTSVSSTFRIMPKQIKQRRSMPQLFHLPSYLRVQAQVKEHALTVSTEHHFSNDFDKPKKSSPQSVSLAMSSTSCQACGYVQCQRHNTTLCTLRDVGHCGIAGCYLA